jgi:hypothetical protein
MDGILKVKYSERVASNFLVALRKNYLIYIIHTFIFDGILSAWGRSIGEDIQYNAGVVNRRGTMQRIQLFFEIKT